MHDLREVGFQLSDNERDIAAAAAAITNWHRLRAALPAVRRPRPTVINGGFARHCEVCETDHFPRTDPAVIVAVVDAADRLLLGGQPSVGQPGLGAGRLRRGGRVAGAGHPPRDR